MVKYVLPVLLALSSCAYPGEKRVDIVLRKIRFGGGASGACDGGAGTEAGGEPEVCGEFPSGPELFELPLDARVDPNPFRSRLRGRSGTRRQVPVVWGPLRHPPPHRAREFG